MPIGEKSTQGYSSVITEEQRKKFLLYRETAKKQGVTPLAFDQWRWAGEPTVPALAKKTVQEEKKELEQASIPRTDALGNQLYPDRKKVIMADTGEEVTYDEYISQIQNELNNTDDETDRTGLTRMLSDVGAKPAAAATPTLEPIVTPHDRTEELRNLADKYKTTFVGKDLDLLVSVANSIISDPLSSGLTGIQALLQASEQIPNIEAATEEQKNTTAFEITDNGINYRVFGTVDKNGQFTESNRIPVGSTAPQNWWETGDLSQIKGIQSQEREPTEFDTLLSQGTPVWLKEFMSEEEFAAEQANTQAWQNYYSQVNAMDPTLFVGQMSPEELASGRDISGIGFNQQWAEDAYQGLIKNLGSQGTSNQNLPDKESFMKEAAGTGIMNTLNQIYNQRGWDTAMTQGTPLKNTAAQSPWWTRDWNLSAQDYKRLSPSDKSSYDKYTGMSGSNWWNPTKGKLGSSGTGITPAYQRQ